MDETIVSARIRADGVVVEILVGGTERPFPKRPMRPMSEEEISAAAAADPDARPMSEAELRAARRIPRVKTLGRVLGLTQEEFASRFHIPLGTLRDWEQGRTESDQPREGVSSRDRGRRRRCLTGAGKWTAPTLGRGRGAFTRLGRQGTAIRRQGKVCRRSLGRGRHIPEEIRALPPRASRLFRRRSPRRPKVQ
jgi:putative transcriptional regulator